MTNIRFITQFDFDSVISKDGGSWEEWLQITQVNNIGRIDREIKQKIIRLNPERQRELYELLKLKFETKQET